MEEREQVLQKRIMLVLNDKDSPCRVWRNNVGVLKDGRGIPIRYGLSVGSADLIGLVMTTGQFLAVEIKTEKGRVSPEQKAWLETIRRMGGQAMVMRSVDEAELLVEQLKKQRPACVTHDDCLDHPLTVGLGCAIKRMVDVGLSWVKGAQ